jgi:hypothetical protein
MCWSPSIFSKRWGKADEKFISHCDFLQLKHTQSGRGKNQYTWLHAHASSLSGLSAQWFTAWMKLCKHNKKRDCGFVNYDKNNVCAFAPKTFNMENKASAVDNGKKAT